MVCMEATTQTSNYMGDAADLAAIRPDCHACNGTGTDAAFGGKCSQCAHENVMEARYAGIRTGHADRAHTPGERMDGRSFGGSTSNAPSEKQVAFIAKLAAERNVPVPTTSTKAAASAAIEELLETKPAQQGGKVGRGNRYPGSCAECGGNVPAMEGNLSKENGKWVTRHVEGGCAVSTPQTAPDAAQTAPAGAALDLSVLPSGRYAVPGSDSRLKLQIDVVAKGKWEGWVFVKDAAEYGQGKRYGSQKPGQLYRGQVESELAAVLADPKAAAAAYGHLVGRCGVCNARLEDEQSVARGIGPVCAQKF